MFLCQHTVHALNEYIIIRKCKEMRRISKFQKSELK